MRTSTRRGVAAAVTFGLILSCGTAAAQTLPDGVAPRHYALELMVDPAAASFSATEVNRRCCRLQA